MAYISPDQDLDLSFLYEIADGSDDFIVDSIGMFLEQSPELLKNIGNAIAAQDWPVAAQAAHKLKPNLGFFGMPISQAIIQEVELACKAGGQNPAEIQDKFNQVNALVSANLNTLKQIKEEKEANL
ncbi:HPt (histidine-containing phosphotransfer) domain-containing protein [Mucilaginibacter oryzae]|uniref:HPt (Histidine-containing phosphotransfer) domain-containing protein n=1 Tax=Mucilaginibacter oryzae TaxID=468058 RepID=A0A316HC82_9SPHI|nr:Hpt domain-containing protein [Mucilaginibacter oryzae]PWK78118.1 HPt (histidine-containing phosphotransfer) domain-containing protein [Mucilaginibacter oryzae]